MKNSKGETDFISLFFLLSLVVLTIVLIVASVPGSFNFFKKFFTSVISSIVVVAVGSFMIIFGIIIAGHSLSAGKTITYLGVATLLIGFLILEMAYVYEMKSALTIYTIQKCSGSGSTSIFGGANLHEMFTCIITGYTYKGNYGTWAFFSFWLFGVLIPIILFVSLFQDFVISSNVIRQKKSQKIVGLSLGLIAYRGFFVTNLLEILSIGSLGIALLALNLVFLGGLLAYIHRVFEKWTPIEYAMGIARGSVNAKRMLKEYAEEAILAADNGNQRGLIDILDMMEALASHNLAWKNYILKARQETIKGNLTTAKNELENLKNTL